MADPLFPGNPAAQPGLLGELRSEVATEAAPLLSFVLRNIRFVVGGVLALIVIIVGYGIWQWRVASVEDEARLELGRILTGRTGAARVSALEAFAAKAPESMRSGVWLAAASAAVSADRPAEAAAAYGRVYANDPDGVLGIVSGLNEADLFRRQGKVQEALALLENLEKVAPQAVRVVVRQDLAATAEQAGDHVRAVRAYEALVQDLTAAPVPGLDSGFYRDRIRQLGRREAAAS